ncbi:Transposase, Ptta/En/Spm, plant [Corchorus capsularis]|uniref:Transposase, Ptta/En/Spm, plant n=1 Tax=Corchorus capsularis TaxID=210143 RepID=A0A1R3FZZ9_COCAP|nr:Transposase, Ptta/En/Spm, plant [Corchorus capsularis]
MARQPISCPSRGRTTSGGVARSTPQSGSRGLTNLDTAVLLPAHVPPPTHGVPHVNSEEEENSLMNDNQDDMEEDEVEQSQHPQSQIEKITITSVDVRTKTVLKYVKRIIMKYYTDAWSCWSEMSAEGKQCYWSNFKAIFIWARDEEGLIRKKYNTRASRWLKNAIHRVRKNDKKPDWIIDEIWVKLKTKWATEDFQKLCQKNKDNRHSKAIGSTTEKDRPIKAVEVFKKIYLREDGTWKEDRARIAHEKFLKTCEERLAQEGEGAQINDDLLWWELASQNRGFGLGNLVEDFQPLLSQPAQSSISQQSDPKMDEVISVSLPSLPPELQARTMESASNAIHTSEDVDQPDVATQKEPSPQQQPTTNQE